MQGLNADAEAVGNLLPNVSGVCDDLAAAVGGGEGPFIVVVISKNGHILSSSGGDVATAEGPRRSGCHQPADSSAAWQCLVSADVCRVPTVSLPPQCTTASLLSDEAQYPKQPSLSFGPSRRSYQVSFKHGDVTVPFYRQKTALQLDSWARISLPGP